MMIVASVLLDFEVSVKFWISLRYTLTIYGTVSIEKTNMLRDFDIFFSSISNLISFFS